MSTQSVTALPSTTQLIALETGAQQTVDAPPGNGPVVNNEIRNIIIIVIVLVHVFIGSILLSLYVWRRQEKKMAKQRGFELDAESTQVVLPKKTNELDERTAELDGTRYYFELSAEEKWRTAGTNAGIGIRPPERVV